MAKMYYSEQETLDILGIPLSELDALVEHGSLQVFQDGPHKRYKGSEVEAIDNSIPESALLDALTFEKLRPHWPEDDVSDFALSAVLIRVRKIVRAKQSM